MTDLFALAALGWSFGFVNGCASRLQNADTLGNGKAGSRFPMWLLFLTVVGTAAIYFGATKAIAASMSGFVPLAVYSCSQAGGVILAVAVTNGPLYRVFHPRAKA